MLDQDCHFYHPHWPNLKWCMYYAELNAQRMRMFDYLYFVLARIIIYNLIVRARFFPRTGAWWLAALEYDSRDWMADVQMAAMSPWMMNAFQPISIRRWRIEGEMPNPMIGSLLAFAASRILRRAEQKTGSSPSSVPGANSMHMRKSPVPIKRPSTMI